MVTNKTRKVHKYRAHVTHGGGHRKKRRGAGSRGGRGNAGSGKRAGQKKAGISRQLGGHGFTSHARNTGFGSAVNVSYFTVTKLDNLVSLQKATKQGDGYKVDLSSLGFSKLLGTGKVYAKIEFTVKFSSKSAEEKVTKAGGSIVTGKVEEKTDAESESAQKAEA